MSDLSKKLRELAEDELDVMVDKIYAYAEEPVKGNVVRAADLLRIAAGGKVQVLRNKVIKQLIDAKAEELLGTLDES